MLGTLVLYFGWDLLFQTGRYQLLIYSALLILLMLVLPNGLLSLRLGRARGRRDDARSWRSRTSPSASAA